MQLADLKKLTQEVELSDNEEELKEFYKKWYLIKHNLNKTKDIRRDTRRNGTFIPLLVS